MLIQNFLWLYIVDTIKLVDVPAIINPHPEIQRE